MGAPGLVLSVKGSVYTASQLTDLSPLLAFALKLTDLSKKILRSYFHRSSEYKIETKGDNSPVTQVDREVETVLREHIRHNFPTHAILGEEFGEESTQKRSDFLWVLDPLDGTRAFITGNPLFGTLVALLHQGRPVLGVMDLPILEQRLWGVQDQTSYLQDRWGTRQLHTRHCAKLTDAIGRSTSPDMFKTEAEWAVLEKFRQGLPLVLYGGDCFCYAQLACGLVDMVIETHLAVYDFLALVPIVEGAGGMLSDWQGHSLDLHSAKGDVLAVGDPRLQQPACELIAADTSTPIS